MVNDIVADSLARMNNGIQRGADEIELLNSKMVLSIVEILKHEGFIDDFKVEGDTIIVNPTYNEAGDPVVRHFIKVSTPGQRMYVTSKQIIPIMNGRGISIISTSDGLMTGAMAKSKGVGGEYICNIW